MRGGSCSFRLGMGVAAVVTALLWDGPVATAQCRHPPGPTCDGTRSEHGLCCTDGGCENPCWDAESLSDRCRELYEPEPAPMDPDSNVTLVDDRDGRQDGHFGVEKEAPKSCATLQATQTGYYALYSTRPLADTCSDQRDETVYFTVTNACNERGWSVERNAGNRYLILDSDNGPSCQCPDGCGECQTLDAASCQASCPDGTTCYGREPVKCCVSTEPVFLGTFFLVQGKNEICMHLWCEDWQQLASGTTDPGFVSEAECSSANSAELSAQWLRAVRDGDTLHRCSGGCELPEGNCLAAPCESMSCPSFCKDGRCVEGNPCAPRDCRWGCEHGLCLQGPRADGEDMDGDGYSALADCDDTRAEVSPGCDELCEPRGTDEDCDGLVDEGCPPLDGGLNEAGVDATLAPEADAGRPGARFTGAGGCTAPGAGNAGGALGLGLLLLWRRSRSSSRKR